MADSASEPPRDNSDDGDAAPEVIHDLDKMIESMELISGGAMCLPDVLPPPNICTPRRGLTGSVLCSSVVQLTWMAYDMVVLRTDPELELSMRSLQEAHERCRAAVVGGQEPEMDSDL